MNFRFGPQRNDGCIDTQHLLTLFSLPNATGLDLNGVTDPFRMRPPSTSDAVTAALR